MRRRRGRALVRRIPRSITADNFFTKFTLVTNISGTSGTAIREDLGFSIGNYSVFDTLRTYFERYRIHKVVVKIIPQFNIAGLSAASATNAYAEIGDHGLLRTPSTTFTATPTYTWQQFVNNDKVKIRRGTSIIKASCIPNIVNYGVALSTTGASTPGIGNMNYKPWVSTSAENVHFFTWQYMRNASSNANTVNYVIYKTIYVQMKDRVQPIFNS